MSPLMPMPKELLEASSGKSLAEIKTEPTTQTPALLSPKLLKETIKSQSKYEIFSNNALQECEAYIAPHEKHTEPEPADATLLLGEKTTDSNTSTGKERRKDDLNNAENGCQGKRSEADKNFHKESTLKYKGTKKLTSPAYGNTWTQEDARNTSNSAAKTGVKKRTEDSDSKNKMCENGTDEESEPRYTVAQLISAFNRHQEIVTKTSLEVTMTTSDKETKIPPIIFNTGNSKFPIGPNALRLFIPDIDITNEPPKRKQKRKYTLGLRYPNESEQNTEAVEGPKEMIETSKDIYQTEDDESFQSLESSSSLTTNDYDSITNLSIPEDTVDEKQNEKPEEKSTKQCKEATTVDSVNENIDSTNNNRNDGSSNIDTSAVEPPTADEVPNAEVKESKPNANVNKFQLSVEVTPNYLRSRSLSSDASATSSEGSSSMSWDELTPPSTATPSSNKNEPQNWLQKPAALCPGQRQASRSRSPSVNRESWGRVCTGTYNRAMEKLVNKQENTGCTDTNRRPNRKSLTLLSPPQLIATSDKVRRKSVSVIKQFS
jgi:hypothetical protein